MLYVVANVYSKDDSNLQRKNLHQPLAGGIHPDLGWPPPTHHLFAGQPATGTGRVLASAGAQARVRLTGTRITAPSFDPDPRAEREGQPRKETEPRIRIRDCSRTGRGHDGRSARGRPCPCGAPIWHQLGIDAILQRAGLSEGACTLTEAMTMNRLICPLSEHAMPDWIRRTALGDLLKEDFSRLYDEALYRNLDRLHPNREVIERELAEREKTLFNLDDTLYLYDLRSEERGVG